MPVAPRALQPERGGPKNLPILSTLLSDWEDDENRGLAQKPHLVIVGGGWGVRTSSYRSVLPDNLTLARQAVGVLDKLNPGDYHVTIVSPETYTTFTPLLPCTLILFLVLTERSLDCQMAVSGLWKCLDGGAQATDVCLSASGIPAAWDHVCSLRPLYGGQDRKSHLTEEGRRAHCIDYAGK